MPGMSRYTDTDICMNQSPIGIGVCIGMGNIGDIGVGKGEISQFFKVISVKNR